ncbi:hypothetical protein AAFF_G00118840, partial [Aldrovandia affinis]
PAPVPLAQFGSYATCRNQVTNPEATSPSDPKTFLMAFGILLLVVAVSVVTWKMLNKHKCVQAETRGAEDRRGHLTGLSADEAPVYENISTVLKPGFTVNQSRKDLEESVYSNLDMAYPGKTGCSTDQSGTPENNCKLYANTIPSNQ